MLNVERIREKFKKLAPVMDERMTRLWAAAEAEALGVGGVASVTKATGILPKRIAAGRKDIQDLLNTPPQEAAAAQRIRRKGGGRKRLSERDPQLVEVLDSLIDPVTRGDPESALRWTSKSTQKLAEEMTSQGHPISSKTVAVLLREMGYSLQGLSKTREGKQHPDRDAQFRQIDRRTKEFHRAGQPVISVDTKKKELIGDFKNGGVEWQPQGNPETVRTHDFMDRDLGKAVPYGIYDIVRNEG